MLELDSTITINISLKDNSIGFDKICKYVRVYSDKYDTYYSLSSDYLHIGDVSLEEFVDMFRPISMNEKLDMFADCVY